ncbi:hypothetical protein M0R04_04205 [Candidatus Dojkabacteria bacterium]|nr:hypothetical protein [Candidatus Dojkabacteria bacterium]
MSTITISKESRLRDGTDNEFTQVIFNDERLDVVLENFQRFLKRCGYEFEGNLGFVSPKIDCVCEDCPTHTDPEAAGAEEMRKFIKVYIEEFMKNLNFI